MAADEVRTAASAPVLAVAADEGSRKVLGRIGRVLAVTDSDEAVAVLRERAVSAVVCDLDATGERGFAAMSAIHQQSADTPVIAMANGVAVDAVVRAFRLGASDFLFKPLTEHALRQALDTLRVVAGQRGAERRRLNDLTRSNAELHEQLAQLREDEEAGRRLQFQLLPHDRLQIGPFHFNRRLCTSLYLSGDFVDYFRIDDEHTGFYVADVAGHGVSPAMVTVLLKSYMNRYLELLHQGKNRGILDPGRIFSRINHNMLRSDMGKHLTMFYGVLSHRDNCLCYCSAGQFPYPVLYDGREARYLQTKGKPLGLFEHAQYHSVAVTLPARFVLTLFSDGILELLPQSELSAKLDYLLGMFSNPRITLRTLCRRLGLDSIGDVLPDDVTVLFVKRGF